MELNMAFDIIPRSFLGPARWRNWLDLDDENWTSFLPSSGLTVSEDDNHVYVEAAVPGIEPEKVDVTFDKGVLWIRGSGEHEDKEDKKKYYRKASSSFSYRVAVPGEIDEKQEPQAAVKNGVMRVTFIKLPEVQPKKITVKKE
jgi:HSP20 family protein